MKFRYIGEEAEPGSGRTIVCGDIHVAVGGEFDCPAHLVARAMRHPFFEAVTLSEPAPAEPELIEPNVGKAALIAIAESSGVKIDKRWNVEKIKAAIEAKTKETE